MIYTKHFLLDKHTAIEYAIDYLKFFSKEEMNGITCVEIGDGNINYVFKLTSKDGKSIVLKQADTLLRSSGRPLDIGRSKIEATILQIEHDLCPNMVPNIFNYNEEMAILAMEDISAYKNLRNELINGATFPEFPEDISTFLVNTLLQTADIVIDPSEKKRRVKEFINIDLCEISETLVFLEPYDDYKGQNNYTKENQSFVEDVLYNNELLKSEVAKLRNNFMNNAQALVHGDLHSGSIFVNQEGTKVIDPEFAFYGPMGYDIGNVIGNLIFALIYHEINAETSSIDTWYSNCIATVYDLVLEKLEGNYQKVVCNSLYKNERFKQFYINNVMSDTLGYAGTEIIRRTIGDSKVKEVTSFDGEKRVLVERILIRIGVSLIMNRESIKSGRSVLNVIESTGRN